MSSVVFNVTFNGYDAGTVDSAQPQPQTQTRPQPSVAPCSCGLAQRPTFHWDQSRSAYTPRGSMIISPNETPTDSNPDGAPAQRSNGPYDSPSSTSSRSWAPMYPVLLHAVVQSVVHDLNGKRRAPLPPDTEMIALSYVMTTFDPVSLQQFAELIERGPVYRSPEEEAFVAGFYHDISRVFDEAVVGDLSAPYDALRTQAERLSGREAGDRSRGEAQPERPPNLHESVDILLLFNEMSSANARRASRLRPSDLLVAFNRVLREAPVSTLEHYSRLVSNAPLSAGHRQTLEDKEDVAWLQRFRRNLLQMLDLVQWEGEGGGNQRTSSQRPGDSREHPPASPSPEMAEKTEEDLPANVHERIDKAIY